jgi:hypothetical protein
VSGENIGDGGGGEDTDSNLASIRNHDVINDS